MSDPRWPEIQRLSDEIGEIAAHMAAAEYRFLECLRRFDALQGWLAPGTLSCAQWLSWRVGMDLGAARERVRVALALPGMPLIGEALRKGEISFSKVRAMSRVATPANEEVLLHIARSSTASQLERLCRSYRQVTEAERGDGGQGGPLRYITRQGTEDGMVRIVAKVRREEADVVWKAIEAAQIDAIHERRNSARGVSAETSKEVGKPERIDRVDAFLGVAEAYLAQAEAPADVPGRYEVLVHVDEGTLRGEPPRCCELEDGEPISAETARRLACDAARIYVREDETGRIIDVGRRSRTIPSALKRALLLRDRGCRFPGCTNRLFVDGHHIEHWADGGETTMENLVLLCRRHHTMVHEWGFGVDVDAEGKLTFHDPGGLPLPYAPRLPPVPEDVIGALAVRHREEGLDIGPRKLIPDWWGDPMDLSLTVQIVQDADRRGRSLDEGDLGG